LLARPGWILASAIGGCFAGMILGFTAIMSGSWVNVPMALIFGAGGVNQWVQYRRTKPKG
jgi:hypothetical protein